MPRLGEICCVGNGKHTFLWTDRWHPLGALYERFGESVVMNRGQVLKCKVSSIIDHGVWKWPMQRSRELC